MVCVPCPSRPLCTLERFATFHGRGSWPSHSLQSHGSGWTQTLVSPTRHAYKCLRARAAAHSPAYIDTMHCALQHALSLPTATTTNYVVQCFTPCPARRRG